MGAGNRVPDYRREINELQLEIRKLWQALANGPRMPPVQKGMPFSWAGPMSGTRTSGPWLAESNLFITGCTLSQGVPPSGTVSVVLLVNGSNVYTFNLFAGSNRGGTQMRHSISTGDKIQLRVTAAGGSDLVALVSYVTNDGW
jgi:hypothetical protein